MTHLRVTRMQVGNSARKLRMKPRMLSQYPEPRSSTLNFPSVPRAAAFRDCTTLQEQGASVACVPGGRVTMPFGRVREG